MKPDHHIRRGLLAAFALSPLQRAWPAPARVLRVGPNESIHSLAEASRLARDGDLVEVQAGDYVGDVANWTQNHLRLVAVGGRVRLLAQGAHARGKGIFVVNGRGVEISGFDFIDAKVPDGIGAGIRFETGSLLVRDCSFTRCEMGLLTNNDEQARLELEGCEFSYGHRDNTFSHLLYVGRIARLTVSACYFHHAERGHLLKSRAAQNLILYNRLSDEAGGTASYELEFPNGGQATVMGNVLDQNAQTDNPLMISYGVEGYVWPRNELDLIHNTLVNLRPHNSPLLRVSKADVRVRIINNLIAGAGSLGDDALGEWRHNPRLNLDQLGAASGYALPTLSPLRNSAVSLAAELRPTRQYQHPRASSPLIRPPLHPGAIQYP
ncbi:right-handed parallel beta-helix repeat-containing protein [Roseateles oligotrophus]|uniref:Right-handed parallel beta-helix repeat-containing protein n=1 Tax=Roseateles oligotrophus TaxID=1769250 RepID=A0ABT2YCK8_9BURK|nr:right-handed parallel beta-helix repeat-containing protein [Roseateles oligotrophus]MCV2367768.1 right-handed parallel beta-helix repeat-containing protein [Roseateles oligotrophus]